MTRINKHLGQSVAGLLAFGIATVVGFAIAAAATDVATSDGERATVELDDAKVDAAKADFSLLRDARQPNVEEIDEVRRLVESSGGQLDTVRAANVAETDAVLVWLARPELHSAGLEVPGDTVWVCLAYVERDNGIAHQVCNSPKHVADQGLAVRVSNSNTGEELAAYLIGDEAVESLMNEAALLKDVQTDLEDGVVVLRRKMVDDSNTLSGDFREDLGASR